MQTQAGGAVLVTGASTGIGRAAALRLARAGRRVFAGVRREADAEGLRAEAVEGLRPLMLEVTDSASIEAARRQVELEVGGTGLAGVVSNAGVTAGGPIEFVKLSELRRVFEVNTIGAVAVTQAFLPLVRRARGRVVLVSSIGGRYAGPIVGPYAASKFALEALGDALRVELRPWGIPVSIVEPGAIRTQIFEKSRKLADEILADLPTEGRERYETTARAVIDRFNRFERQALPPDRVARAIEHALHAARPKTRYLVGPDARVQALLAWALPDRARDWVTVRLYGIPHRQVGPRPRSADAGGDPAERSRR
jgi:NAD(P)-dependent dehydrogenase (short-subunit alcohol dehydrogenase family)